MCIRDRADIGPSGAGTSKGSPVASSSIGWSTGDSASESGLAICVDSAKDFPMEPMETDAAAEMFEAASSYGTFLTYWHLLHVVSCLNSLVTGVRPQGALASREPADLPGESRGDMSTSTSADAAVLDALYGDLPSYRCLLYTSPSPRDS